MAGFELKYLHHPQDARFVLIGTPLIFALIFCFGFIMMHPASPQTKLSDTVAPSSSKKRSRTSSSRAKLSPMPSTSSSSTNASASANSSAPAASAPSASASLGQPAAGPTNASTMPVQSSPSAVSGLLPVASPQAAPQHQSAPLNIQVGNGSVKAGPLQLSL